MQNIWNNIWDKKSLPLFLCAIFFIIYISPLATHPLMEPDEGRYAEIAREMNESGDYVTPKLNYVKYFEKPALLYWTQALSFKILGENEFAARLPSSLAAILGIAVTGLLAASIYGRRAGIIAAVITGTSLLYIAIGTLDITDMLVSFFITLAMASCYIGHMRKNRRWYLVFYAAMALGLLSKGLIAVLLPGGIIFWYIVITRKWRLIPDILYLPGIILFLAIVFPWFYLVCEQNPDFFYFFFIQEHFLRFATKMHDRYQPFWFFLPIILAGLLPWTAFFFALGGRGSVLRAPASCEEKDANIFLALWFGVTLLFFSASGSKLIPYIVPCIPPAAILMAANIDRSISGAGAGRVFLWNAGVNLLFVAALFLYALFGKIGGETPRSEAVVIALFISAGLVLSAFFSYPYKDMRDMSRASAVLCAGGLLFAFCVQTAYIPFGRERSVAEAARIVAAGKRDSEKIAAFGDIFQAMPFYTKERLVLVGYKGELAYGASQETDSARRTWFPSREEFIEEWNAGVPYVLVMEKRKVKDFFQLGAAGARETANAGNYMIFFNGERD
ncbi:glycosyl transferase [Synergistales bacterium]|nr:glycosyl transferase [Synergistales bacterium]